jgi:hypothetical protein
MTLGTGHLQVGALQSESRLPVVIELDVLPL